MSPFAKHLALFAVLAAGAALAPVAAQAAETPAGQAITNQATATYNDPAGNAYSTASNVVTTYVQNAPTLTVNTDNGSAVGSAATATNVPVVPGGTITDVYTLTNTGNNTGDFQVPSSPTSGVTGAGTDNGQTSGVVYTATNLPAPGASQCSSQPFTSIAALNSCLATQNVAAAGSITVSVQYSINQSATAPGSVTTALNATLSYAQVNANTPAATSATVANTYNDPVSLDARLDLQKASTQNTTTGNITYTITANNGGATATHYLALATDLPSLPSSGVLISDKIPTFGTPTAAPLALQSVPTFSVATGALTSGASAQLVYTTSATGTTGWTVYSSGNLPANTAYVGVYISGGTSPVGGACTTAAEPCGLVAAPSGSSNSGGVGTVTTPQVTLTFTVAPPSGPGSGNSGAVKNMADSAAGSNGASGPCVIGPGTSAPSGCTTDNAANLGSVVTNATPSNAPSGSSNQVSNQALLTQSVLNGPVGNPGATGSFDGVSAVNTTDDFTAAGICNTVTSVNSTSVIGNAPTGNSIATSGCATIIVANAIQNTGNASDTYTLTTTAPTGWTAVFCSDAACASPLPSSKITVASNTTVTYYAKYVPPASITTLLQYDFPVNATGLGGSGDANATHDDLYAGFVALTKTATVTSTGCPSGVTPSSGVCPGGVIGYDVNYKNIAQLGGSGNTEPATALLGATAVVITENGTTAPNTWGTYSNGLNAPATDTTSGTTFSGNTVGSKSFTDTIASLAPAGTGDLKFAVTIN